jgi:hypothetical protein
MRENKLPDWAAKIGAEVRARTVELPLNEPYLVDVTELLKTISVRELAHGRGRKARREER